MRHPLILKVFLLSVLVGPGLCSCSLRPGSLRKLEKQGIRANAEDVSVAFGSSPKKDVEVTYLGSGGVLLNFGGDAIVIDPFFSNQRTGKIGKSVFMGKDGRKILRSDRRMVETGLSAMERSVLKDSFKLHAILNAHSHYDHLMDIPAVFAHYDRQPKLLLTRSGLNIVHQTIDTAKVILLENHQSTSEVASAPIELKTDNGVIRVYPVLADHNPHFRNIKFFSGSQEKPTFELSAPYAASKANLWLEGNTFSFLIDYVNGKGDIEFRTFVQSSSCNPPAGIPPASLLSRPVDLACLGVVSYKFSPGYPCALLEAIEPREVLWIHWEDFFRKYTKKPKTVRGTDVPQFFSLPCVRPFHNSGKLLWPRVKMTLDY
jgi:hypothetical protein